MSSSLAGRAMSSGFPFHAPRQWDSILFDLASEFLAIFSRLRESDRLVHPAPEIAVEHQAGMATTSPPPWD
ncbi:MAG TPA: hypothetical protein VNL74_06720 [Methylococcus sp.]|nr:hypothetical protein [Methylococcus sp.]